MFYCLYYWESYITKLYEDICSLVNKRIIFVDIFLFAYVCIIYARKISGELSICISRSTYSNLHNHNVYYLTLGRYSYRNNI